MAWTAPTTRSTGNLITASIWNTDLVNNLSYLKNAPTFDGTVTLAGNPATYGLIFDGSNGGGIAATHASGTLRFYAGGTTEQMRIDTDGDVGVKSGAKVYLDGVGVSGNTYISEPGADTMVLHVGTIEGLYMTDAAFYAISTYSDTTGDAVNMSVASDGRIRRSTSARKYKQDERPFTGGLRELLQLSPVTYEEKDKPGPRFVGFIADDSVDATPLLVSRGPDGAVEGYQYDRLTTYLVNAVKEISARLTALEANG